jgi:hypothetical protein
VVHASPSRGMIRAQGAWSAPGIPAGTRRRAIQAVAPMLSLSGPPVPTYGLVLFFSTTGRSLQPCSDDLTPLIPSM